MFSKRTLREETIKIILKLEDKANILHTHNLLPDLIWARNVLGLENRLMGLKDSIRIAIQDIVK